MKKRILIVLYSFFAFFIIFISINVIILKSKKTKKVVVAAKNIAESQMLAEMMSLLIEKNSDLKVIKKYNLEGSFVTYNAMIANDIDIFPDYTGTALMAILKEKPIYDSSKAYQFVKDTFLKKFNIVWLKPFGFRNNYALMMLKEKAEKLNIKTMTDAFKYKFLKYGFNAEFMAREEFKLMIGKYDVDFKTPPKVMDHILLYFSLENEAIDVMNGFTTDGNILHYDLEILEDDKKVFPEYLAAPLIRGEVLEKYPFLKDIIEKLANKISDEKMQKMNYEADYKGNNTRKIAKKFLIEEGLL